MLRRVSSIFFFAEGFMISLPAMAPHDIFAFGEVDIFRSCFRRLFSAFSFSFAIIYSSWRHFFFSPIISLFPPDTPIFFHFTCCFRLPPSLCHWYYCCYDIFRLFSPLLIFHLFSSAYRYDFSRCFFYLSQDGGLDTDSFSHIFIAIFYALFSVSAIFHYFSFSSSLPPCFFSFLYARLLYYIHFISFRFSLLISTFSIMLSAELSSFRCMRWYLRLFMLHLPLISSSFLLLHSYY